MPIEVSPAPFRRSMQLPYTPMFIPETIPQPGTGLSMPNVAATASESVIIPPNPGGIASPHHAIPALAEAGYTAPTFRAASMMMDARGNGGQERLPGPRPIAHLPSAGGSMYGGQSPRMLLEVGGQFCDGLEPQMVASLPAPRPAPRIQTAYLDEDAFSGHVHHRQHHHTEHHHRHHDRPHLDDDDGGSDASYYARPKLHRHRSGSAVSSSTRVDGLHEHRHHRSGSLGAHSPVERHPWMHRRTPSLQPRSQDHSPVISSPLSVSSELRNHDRTRSPFTPLRARPGSGTHHKIGSVDARYRPVYHSGHKERDQVDIDELGMAELRLDEHQARGRKSSRLMASDNGRQHKPSQCSGRERSIVRRGKEAREVPTSRVDQEVLMEAEEQLRLKQDDRSAVNVERGRERQSQRGDRAKKPPDSADVPPGFQDHHHDYHHDHHRDHHHDHHHDRSGPARGAKPSTRERKGHSQSDNASFRGARQGSRQKHDQHLSPHRLAPAMSISDSSSAPRRRTHSHSHMHHTLRQQPPSRPPHDPGALHPHDMQDPYRRRAVSMHLDHGLIGLYKTPSVAGHSEDGFFDDGASIAGSGLTFMDGPVGGRTSQYGLPQYAHVVQPDPRRFMVQRGNADVFLD